MLSRASKSPASSATAALRVFAALLRFEAVPASLAGAATRQRSAGVTAILIGDRHTPVSTEGPFGDPRAQWALPALELVSSSLRPGAIVACDNTTVAREECRDYFEFVHDPRNRFRTMTVPFQGGFELTVRI